MIKQFYQKHHTGIILAVLVLAALPLRLYLLLHRGSFWFDEAFSIHFAALDWGRIWYYMLNENNPPLHIFILHLFSFIFPLSEVATRLLSIIFSLISIPVIYALGKKMFASREVGYWAAGFVSISVLQLLFSVEARPYSLLFLLSLLSTYFYWDFLGGKIKSKSWWLYLFFTLALVYTHLFGWLIVGTQILVLMINWRRSDWRKFLPAVAAVLGGFLIWYWPAFSLKIQMPISQGWFFSTDNCWYFGLKRIQQALVFIGDGWWYNLIFGGLIAGLLILALFHLPPKNQRPPLFTAAIWYCLIPLIFPLTLGFLPAKYYIGCFLGLYLLLALGAVNLKLSWRRQLIAGVFLWLLFFNFGYSMATFVHHDWSAVGDYLAEEQAVGAEKVIVSRFHYGLMLDYYYHGDLPVIEFLPLKGKSADDDLNLIKYNWLHYLNQDNINELTAIVGDSRRVVLAQKEISTEKLVEEWFRQNGWRQLSRKNFLFMDGLEVFLWEKP
ncbi:MAG: glycosyltransferase family 39 protein [Patescibacteria group bacterium]|jgi:uncharacterized membrane protein